MARSYNVDQVQLTWNALDFKEGLAEGTQIQINPNAPRRSKKVTGSGHIVIVENPDRSGTVVLTVDVESRLHQLLLALYESEVTTVLPMVLVDLNTGRVSNFSNAFIEAGPAEPFASEASTVPWTFGFERQTDLANPTDQNVVGT